MSLEEQFQESEKQRLNADNRKTRLIQGLPLEETEALEKAKQLIETETLDPAELTEKVKELLSYLKIAMDKNLNVQIIEAEIEDLNDRVETATLNTDTVMQQLSSLQTKMSDLALKVQSEIEKNEKTRLKEKEVLDKLNKYLDDWL